MNDIQDLENRAEHLSRALQDELAVLAKEFENKVRSAGKKYGVLLFTEVTVGIDSKKSGEQ
jgi:SepF-like predicted cell division protein (DUF552 family)